MFSTLLDPTLTWVLWIISIGQDTSCMRATPRQRTATGRPARPTKFNTQGICFESVKSRKLPFLWEDGWVNFPSRFRQILGSQVSTPYLLPRYLSHLPSSCLWISWSSFLPVLEGFLGWKKVQTSRFDESKSSPNLQVAPNLFFRFVSKRYI